MNVMRCMYYPIDIPEISHVNPTLVHARVAYIRTPTPHYPLYIYLANLVVGFLCLCATADVSLPSMLAGMAYVPKATCTPAHICVS